MFRLGQHVRIVDSKSAFHLKTGKLTAKVVESRHEEGYWHVKLDSSPLNVAVFERQIVHSETQQYRTLKNLYRRYTWVRLEVLSEVLELLRVCDGLDDASDVILTYMHANSRRCMESPTAVLSLLPAKDRVSMNDLIRTKQMEDVEKKNGTKKVTLGL